MRQWLAIVLIGVSILTAGTANAEPTQVPAPGPAATSTSDELVDMVMDVIEHGGPAAPTTTPAPAPPN
jgi:nitrous oxide reductase accessory protein NosL